MNILLSCIGKRSYIADYFRAELEPGEQIYGTSHTPWTSGFAACDTGLIMPPIVSDEYVPALVEACRYHEITGLLSFYDADVVRLSEHLDTFGSAGVLPLIPGPQAAWDAFDKWRTYQVLAAAGIAVPATTVRLEDARQAVDLGSMQYPLIIKPRMGFGSKNVYVAYTDHQLEAFFSIEADMLIQQFMDGEMYGIEALSDPDGTVLEVTAWRKIESRLGETEQAITVDDADVLELGHRLAKAISLVGPMDVDLFRMPDGSLVVLELNLRFGGGYAVSHLAGANFPELIVDIFRNRHPQPVMRRFHSGIALMKGLRVLGGPVGPFLAGLRSGGSKSEDAAW